MNRTRSARAVRVLNLIILAAVAILWAPRVQTQADLQPPTVVNQSPSPQASGVSPVAAVSATFSEPVQPASIAFELRDNTNALVPAALTYEQSDRTAVLQPADALPTGGTYTASVTSAVDLAGHALAAPVVWSFTVSNSAFQDRVVFEGLDAPTVVEFASDGRVFVAEKKGVIQVFDSMTDTTPSVFADLRTKVHDFGGRGLLGMALDPAFPSRPFVYVLYTHDAPVGGTAPTWGSVDGSNDPCPGAASTGCAVSARLSRLEASGSQMTGTEQVLVEDWYQQFPTHSIGDLVFGPDGSLYASAGDGAATTFIDSGQTANPNPDPAGQGGALRSQDLQTPADPVSLSGSVIRVDPDSGAALRRAPLMTVAAPTVEPDGTKTYQVSSVYLGSAVTSIRVVEPTSPAPGKPRRILFVLPSEAGTGPSPLGDGLAELRLLDVPNRFNATLIAPSFPIEPWYGDHSTDLSRRLERFVVSELVPFADGLSSAPPADKWLIGLGPSGFGALSLLLRNPHVFAAAAAWDAPVQLDDVFDAPGAEANFGSQANFNRYAIPALVQQNAEAFTTRNRIWISGDDSLWTADMALLDQQMTQAGVQHTFVPGTTRAHGWFSGWLDGAVTWLDARPEETDSIAANARRVIAYGLRHPARMAVRPGTSEIWLGDSGPGTVDELNRVAGAADGNTDNFGWPCVVGSSAGPYSGVGLTICDDLIARPADVVSPFHAFASGQPLFAGDPCTTTNGSSLSGATFLGNGGYPAEYDGALILADRRRGCIWALPQGGDGLPNAAASVPMLANAASPVDLTVGPGGQLFYVDQDGGTVRRIVHTAGNLPPVAAIQGTPLSGFAPLNVTFTAAPSSDPESAPLTFEWDLDGDGAFDDSTSVAPSFTYTTTGTHTVLVRVRDGFGGSDVAAITVEVSNAPPTPIIATPTPSLTWAVGDTIAFAGSATDPEDGTLAAERLSWSLLAHHCPSSCHTHVIQDFIGVSGGTVVAPEHEYPSHLELRLTATDSNGAQSSTSVLLQPRTVNLSFASSPSGLQVTVGATTSTTPFVRTVIAGSSNPVTVVSPQLGQQFASWSDGGAQSHTIVAPASAQTYTVNFLPVIAPPPAGLVAGYSFNEGSGTTSQDVTTNNLTATLNGAAWTTEGRFGNALSFDGVNDMVTVADANALDLTTAMTVEAWVYPTSATGVRDILIKEGAGVDIYNLYARNGQGLPESNIYVGGTNRWTSGTALALNTWSHVAGTYDGTTLRLYVNGVQASSTNVSGAIATSTGALRIGGNSLWGEFFQGRIDEVRVYNRALSAAEIATDRDTPVGSPAVDATPPVLSNGVPSAPLPAGTTQAVLGVTTSEPAYCRYGTSPGTAFAALPNPFTASGSTTHTSTVTGLVNGGSYTYYVRCQDIAGNATTSDYAVSFAVSLPGQDTVSPTVAITAPLDESTVAGVVTVTVTASDDVGVAGVQLIVDGANYGAEDTSAPFSIPWDTTATSAGEHTLQARARDAAGNVGLSAIIGVSVGNNPVPANFVDEVVVGAGVTFPTSLEFLPDGRMLVTEFTGRVLVVQPGAFSPDPTPVLVLPNFFSEDVTIGGERGLVNVLADPGFATNGFIYVFYTAASPQRDRVSRFTMTGNTADPASELVVWQAVANSISTDHHGGGLAFGPDGKLYISSGDNGDPQSVQSLTSDHGKLLRVNADGTVPADNPFYDGPGGNIDAIWALGLRNPYRFSFDSVTGRLYIGDVGQSLVEEIDLGVAGANYGWPVCEGPCGTSGMTNPLFSFTHNGRDASITGGFVYRASQFPEQYQGAYFYGDFAQNWIRYLTLNAEGTAVTGGGNFLPADGSLDGPYDPVMIKPGPDGSLYYVDFGWGWQSTANPASIRRIRYVAGNQPPVAASSATPTTGVPPLSVNFSSAGSVDPENQPLSYTWTFGDGDTSTLANPVHVYTQPGVYTAQLSVSDGENSTSANPLTISVGTLPVGTITSPANGSTFRAGDVITFTGTATDAEDGPLTGAAMTWTVLFHHDSHVHPAVPPTTGSNSGVFTIQTSGHDFTGATNYEIILTVTDSNGLQSTSSVTVVPEKVNLTFASNPAGLTVTIDGVSHATPYVHDTLVGFQHSIGAPAQVSGPLSYAFGSWSDGGAQTHTIVVPASPQTYTATFTTNSPPLPAGLVAGYAFNEGTGTTTLDVTTNNLTGTLSGATWTTEGKFGNALSFDGVNDLVTVADANALDLTTGMTLEAWVYPTASGGGSWRNVLIKERPANGEAYNLYANTPGNVPSVYVVRAAQTGTPLNASGTAVLPANTWTHLAATYNGSVLRLYVNGVQVGTRNVSGAMVTSSGALRVGGNSMWGEFFQGRLDEIRIYNRALTAAEIATDMATPLVAVPSDTTPPVLSNGLPTGTLPAGTTQATLSLTTNEAATCRYGVTPGTAYASLPSAFTTSGGTSHSTAVAGLVNGTSYTYYVRCQDAAGNPTTTDFVIAFSVAAPADTTPPVLSNGLPTGTLAAGTTQATLSLTTNEAATCRYGLTPGTAYASLSTTFTTTGGASHSTVVTGLVNGTSYTYYVRCQDAAGNPTTTDFVIAFSVAAPADTTPPVLSNGLPTGTLAAGTTQATLSLTTNEAATCRYGLTPGTAYASLPTTFTTTGGASHSTVVTGLVNGTSYTYYVRCQDAAGNPTTTDFVIAFSVAAPADTTPPVLSNGLPTGALAAGTTQATLSLTTNEAATCRYGVTPGTAYASLPSAFATTGGTNHSTAVTGLVNGTSYTYYVRCQDTAGNPTATDFVIAFSVAAPADTTPPVLSNGLPTGTLAAGTTQATLSLTTNEAATCRYGVTPGTAYASLPLVLVSANGVSHSALVSGLVSGASYTYYVRCQDTAGNPTLSDFVIAFNVAAPGDATPPTVSMTAPSNGATVSGSVTVTANAADNVGVVGVQFLLDGAALGAEDTSSPYTVSWSSTGVANGAHQLSARARDAAGNQTTSAVVNVTVNNPSNLVAAYGFNENTGSTLGDSSGGNRNGTISGATWTTQGRFGNALSFDGVNDWVTVADSNALDLTTGMTLEAWVYPTVSGGGAWRNVLMKERPGGEVYNIYANDQNNVPTVYVIRAAQTGTPLNASGTTALPANTWTHLAATYDGTTLRFYVNGTQVGTRAVSGALLTSNRPLRIGGNSVWGEYFQGRIDEIRIYNRALSASEIQTDMNAPVP